MARGYDYAKSSHRAHSGFTMRGEQGSSGPHSFLPKNWHPGQCVTWWKNRQDFITSQLHYIVCSSTLVFNSRSLQDFWLDCMTYRESPRSTIAPLVLAWLEMGGGGGGCMWLARVADSSYKNCNNTLNFEDSERPLASNFPVRKLLTFSRGKPFNSCAVR